MREPSKYAREQQEHDRLQQKVMLINEAWQQSERILGILRPKHDTMAATEEQKLTWAKRLKIIL